MNDPPRLLDSGDEHVAAMLRAARNEGHSSSGMQNALATVGVGTGVLSAAQGAAGALSAGGKGTAAGALSFATGPLVVIKWVGIGMVGGLVAAGGTTTLMGPHESMPPSSSQPVVVVATEPQHAEETPQRVREEAEDGAPALLPDTSRNADTAAAQTARTSNVWPLSTGAGAARSSDRSVTNSPTEAAAAAFGELDTPLAHELTLLERARSSLTAGDAAQALEWLRTYDVQTRTHHLLPEARYLRMEASAALGDANGARHAARQLLTLETRSARAAKARAILTDQERQSSGSSP